MITPDKALQVLPDGLRRPLLEEYGNIVTNFMERRWRPSELSGGRFCEIIYSILEGYASGSYPPSPVKPRNFVDACRRLEVHTNVPRSFQILIPRLLPGLYEIRNNRQVGHAAGDVEPDFMDSSLVVSIASWIIAELVRVFHGVSTAEAQNLVNNLVERRLPIIWKSGDIKRVLRSDLSLKDQILILLASEKSKVQVDTLFSWIEYEKRGYFNRVIRQLHRQRLVEFNEMRENVELLPPGADYVSNLLKKLNS
ncbi:hypothetical protein DRQ11_12515 [candidate division KSB1 bacterium]|nr:MAG: hypothetical protein DRQ11_12515 [candidate division KSB1 bacterium]